LPKTTLRLSDSEGKVLSILFEKLEEIKNALHSDKVFDVISEVLYGKNLAQLLLDAAAIASEGDGLIFAFQIT